MLIAYVNLGVPFPHPTNANGVQFDAEMRFLNNGVLVGPGTIETATIDALNVATFDDDLRAAVLDAAARGAQRPWNSLGIPDFVVYSPHGLAA